MADIDDSQPRMIIGKLEGGVYRLTVDDEDDERIDVDDVDQTELFRAEGTAPAGRVRRMVTPEEPNGPLYLYERESEAEDWERVGEVTFAESV